MGFLFERPYADPVVLTRQPALASRMRRDHPDQIRLEALLTAVDEEGEPAVAGIAGDVAVELTIGLAPEDSLTWHRELDNYLLPVVSRLGQRRIPAAFARKVRTARSTLTAGPARFRHDGATPMLQVRATGSYEEPGWKEQIRAACQAAVGAGAPQPGTAALDVAFVVSSTRNWTNLWKPAIDAIDGPILGVPNPESPWSPNDDHITRLGLHRTIDNSVGFDIVVRAWWHPDST
jgi:hypothetical protein